MQLGSEGAVIPLPAASTEQSHAEGQRKFDFYCSKGHRLAYYLFVFHVKLSAVWGMFVLIRAHEIITIRDFLAPWKIFVCET